MRLLPRQWPWSVWHRGWGPAGSTGPCGPVALTWLSAESRAWTESTHTKGRVKPTQPFKTYQSLAECVNSMKEEAGISILHIWMRFWCEPCTGWWPRRSRWILGSHSTAEYYTPLYTLLQCPAGHKHGRTTNKRETMTVRADIKV